MLYVIQEDGVVCANSVREMNKKINGSLNKEDLKICGKDRVIIATKEDINFLQDKKVLESIPLNSLFFEDKSLKFICIGNMILSIILFLFK